MYTITIQGFKTKEEADAWASWYEGQGEQQADEASQCRDNPFPTYTEMMNWKNRWDGQNMNIHLQPVE